MQLGQSELAGVSEALRELYAHTDASSLPHCIVRLLHRLIPADSAACNSFDFRTGQMLVVHDHGPDGDKYLPALQKRIHEHPLLVHVRNHWLDGAAALSDIASHRELRDLAIYSEFLHPLRIERQLGLLVEDQAYGVTAVSLQRDGRDFSLRDKDVLTFLQPHIIQAFKNAADLTGLKKQSEGLAALASACEIAAIWLSGGEKVEWMSSHAERLLRNYFSGCGSSSPSNHTRLPAAVAMWVRAESSKQRAGRATGWRAEQLVPGLRGDLRIRWISEHPARSYLLLSEQTPAPSPAQLRSLGLTSREAEVLFWIAQDKTNDVIAILLSISKRTVEKHTERILAKLSVESRLGAALRARSCLQGLF